MGKLSREKANTLKDLFKYIDSNVLAMNQSKIFAGLIIITLNISSKFVSFKLSKTMEGYLKYTFSRNILVFAMAWMGTRDIYTALFITLIFIIFTNFLLNEESMFCCLPKGFTEHHTSLMDAPPEDSITSPVSDQQINDAMALLANAKKQRENLTTNTKPQSKHVESISQDHIIH